LAPNKLFESSRSFLLNQGGFLAPACLLGSLEEQNHHHLQQKQPMGGERTSLLPSDWFVKKQHV